MSLRIVTANVSDSATITSSDFAGTLPASNLQLEGRGRVARTSNATGAKAVLGDFAAAAIVSACVLYGNNLTSAATWRLQLYSGAGQTGSLVYDSGTVAAQPAIGWGDAGWGLFPWGASVFTGWASAHSVLWFTAVTALSFRLTLTDAANPAGYLQAKRLLIGPYFQPTVNLAYGLTLSWRDNSTQRRTQGGSLRTDNQVRYRAMAGTLQYLAAGERASLQETLRQIALRSETFISVYPGMGGALERDHSLLGKFTQMPDFSAENPGAWRTDITFEEV